MESWEVVPKLTEGQVGSRYTTESVTKNITTQKKVVIPTFTIFFFLNEHSIEHIPEEHKMNLTLSSKIAFSALY